MPNKSSDSKKILSVICGLVLLTFVFLLGYSVGLKQAEQQKDIGYQQALDEVKGKLGETGLLLPTEETSVINGSVTAVGEGSLDIDAVQLVSNPLEEPAPVKRHITVGADTKITRSIPLSPEEMDAAMKKFDAAQKKFDADVKAGREAEPPLPPASAILEIVQLSDIMVGDQVRIVASDNIAFAAEFAAVDILVVGGTEAPPEEPQPEPPAEGEPTTIEPAVQ